MATGKPVSAVTDLLADDAGEVSMLRCSRRGVLVASAAFMSCPALGMSKSAPMLGFNVIETPEAPFGSEAAAASLRAAARAGFSAPVRKAISQRCQLAPMPTASK